MTGLIDYQWIHSTLTYKRPYYVLHKRLILKLEKLRINGNLLCCIKNFLSQRKQRVVLNGILSDWTNMISGVPQD